MSPPALRLLDPLRGFGICVLYRTDVTDEVGNGEDHSLSAFLSGYVMWAKISVLLASVFCLGYTCLQTDVLDRARCSCSRDA